MKLLAKYTDAHVPDLQLLDLETQEVIHVISYSATCRSLTHAAGTWAKENGHEIAEWDRSNLV